jgi:hypothetical protein
MPPRTVLRTLHASSLSIARQQGEPAPAALAAPSQEPPLASHNAQGYVLHRGSNSIQRYLTKIQAHLARQQAHIDHELHQLQHSQYQAKVTQWQADAQQYLQSATPAQRVEWLNNAGADLAKRVTHKVQSQPELFTHTPKLMRVGQRAALLACFSAATQDTSRNAASADWCVRAVADAHQELRSDTRDTAVLRMPYLGGFNEREFLNRWQPIATFCSQVGPSEQALGNAAWVDQTTALFPAPAHRQVSAPAPAPAPVRHPPRFETTAQQLPAPSSVAQWKNQTVQRLQAQTPAQIAQWLGTHRGQLETQIAHELQRNPSVWAAQPLKLLRLGQCIAFMEHLAQGARNGQSEPYRAQWCAKVVADAYNDLRHHRNPPTVAHELPYQSAGFDERAFLAHWNPISLLQRHNDCDTGAMACGAWVDSVKAAYK